MSLKPTHPSHAGRQLILAGGAAVATAQPADSQIFAARAQKAFDLAQKNYLADTNSTTAAANWRARALMSRTWRPTSRSARNSPGTGIAVCRHWLAREAKSAAGHYYLAMNLGKLARGRSSVARGLPAG